MELQRLLLLSAFPEPGFLRCGSGSCRQLSGCETAVSPSPCPAHLRARSEPRGLARVQPPTGPRRLEAAPPGQLLLASPRDPEAAGGLPGEGSPPPHQLRPGRDGVRRAGASGQGGAGRPLRGRSPRDLCFLSAARPQAQGLETALLCWLKAASAPVGTGGGQGRDGG